MTPPYIPARAADFESWFNNFTTKLSANPAAYMITPADAAHLASGYAAWRTAYLLTLDPSTRTAVTIAQRNLVKAQWMPTIRTFAMFIKMNPGVSDELKVGLGLNLNAPSSQPVPVPITSPVLTIKGISYGEVTMDWRDSAESTGHAKPFGAVAGLFFVSVGNTPSVEPTEALWAGMRTKRPIAFTFTPEQNGKIATVWGKWVNRKGQEGPWGAPVSFTIWA